MEVYEYKKRYGDLTGKKFGRLLVLELKNTTKSNKYTWECKCDCGTHTTIPTGALKSGNTKSCGCLSIERLIKSSRLFKGESGFNEIYSIYRRSAKKRGLLFSLTEEEFKILTKDNCYYCKQEPNNTIPKQLNARYKTQTALKHAEYTYNGIDRIDNNIGYTNENCVSCCKRCNIMKMDSKKDEFLEHIKKIYETLVKTKGN